MKSLRSLALLATLALFVVSCAKHGTPTPVDGLTVYTDQVRDFSVKTPTGWFTQKVPGELIVVHSSKEAARRFMSYGKGPAGCKIEYRVIRLDSTRTIDTVIQRSKLEFEDNLPRGTVTSTTFAGSPAKKLTLEFEQEDGTFKSEAYFVQKDSLVTVLYFGAFGGTYKDYASTFDEILKSATIAKDRPKVEVKKDTAAPRGPEPPSDTLRNYSAPEFSMDIPQNFQGMKSTSAGVISSVNMVGSRLDCNIQVDVFDASKQNNLDKIIEQNKAKYGTSPNSTTLGGQKAAYFSYGGGQVSSRAYFTVKGNRMFRVTVNMYKPDQGVYQPIFDKCLGSFKMK